MYIITYIKASSRIFLKEKTVLMTGLSLQKDTDGPVIAGYRFS